MIIIKISYFKLLKQSLIYSLTKSLAWCKMKISEDKMKVKEVKIKEILEEQGKSQKWLAKKTGYTAVYINLLTSGKQVNPSLRVAHAIAKALKKKINKVWIFEENGKDNKVILKLKRLIRFIK